MKSNKNQKKGIINKSKNNSKNSNVVKIKSSFESKNFIHSKKLKITLIVTILIILFLIGRIKGTYL